MLSAIAFICAVGILGWLALAGLGEPRNSIERLGLSFGVGAGFLTFALFTTRLPGISFSILSVGVAYVILMGLALLFTRRSDRTSLSMPRIAPIRLLDLVVLILIGLAFIVVFAIAAYWQPYFSDELRIWVFKGKLLAAGDSLDLAAHPSYPLNLPFQIASLELLGSDFVHGLLVVYYVSLVLVFFSHLREWTDRRVALFCAFFLSTTPIFLWQSTLAYANIPFAFYYVASTLSLYRYLKQRDERTLLLAGILIGLAGWTRPEGLLYFAINLFVLLLFSPRNRAALKYVLAYGAIFVALWTPWTVYAQWMGYGGLLASAAGGAREIVSGNIDVARIADIASYAISRATSIGDWGVVWLTFPLALAMAWRRLREDAALLALIGLNVVGIIFTYYAVGSDLQGNTLAWWLYTGFDRMALHWAPLVLFYFGLALHKSSIMDDVMNSTRIRIDPYLILLIFFSIFAIAPLLGPGYFWGAHDGRHSVYFLFEFDRAIQDGIFYPRWAPDFTFGFGYPFFNIYAPGAFFVSEAFHLLGADYVTATKIVFALAILLSGPAMFGFVKRLTNSSQAAFISGLVYVYVPYHIVDIYVRAALAELVALIFLPLTLWGFYNAVLNPSRKTIVAAALAYGAMHFTHNGIALLFTPVLMVWILFLMIGELKKRHIAGLRSQITFLIKSALPSLAASILGIGLAGIFVIPALLEFQYIRTDQWLSNYYDYTNHFPYLYQLFSPYWGFGISVAGTKDEMSFQLGAVPALLGIFAIFSILKNPNSMRRYWLFFLALTLIVIALMLPVSLPLWEALRLVTFAQFPWRLLTLTNVSLAILAGAVILQSSDEMRNDEHALSLPAILLGALIVLGSFPYLTAQTTPEAKEGPVSILGLFKFQQSAGEMTGVSAWVEEIPTWSPMADVLFANRRVKSKVDFSDFDPDKLWFGVDQDAKGIHSYGETFEYDAKEDNMPVTWNIDYYPGWRVYLADKVGGDLRITRELKTKIVGEHGRIQVDVPQGRHWIIMRFEDTMPRIIGMGLSAVSILVVLGLFAWDFRESRRSSVAAA